MITSKYYWQTILVLTLVNFPKIIRVANEQKRRSVMHGNSRAQKVILGHIVRKVRNNRVRKEKGLIKRKVQRHIEQEAHET